MYFVAVKIYTKLSVKFPKIPENRREISIISHEKKPIKIVVLPSELNDMKKKEEKKWKKKKERENYTELENEQKKNR